MNNKSTLANIVYKDGIIRISPLLLNPQYGMDSLSLPEATSNLDALIDRIRHLQKLRVQS